MGCQECDGKLELIEQFASQQRKLREEVERLKDMLRVEPNVCTKCGAFLGLLAEVECPNCEKLKRLRDCLDELSDEFDETSDLGLIIKQALKEPPE